jgi:hypothetical protein
MPSYFNTSSGTESTTTNGGTTVMGVTQTRTATETGTNQRDSTATETGNNNATENRTANTSRNGGVTTQRALTADATANEAKTELADIGGQVTFKIMLRGHLGTVPEGVIPPPSFLNAQTS